MLVSGGRDDSSLLDWSPARPKGGRTFVIDGEPARFLIAGVDGSGRSYAQAHAKITDELVAAEGFRHGIFYDAPSAPPPMRPEERARYLDVQVGPGLARWSVVEYGPDQEYGLHHTDTLDFDVVLRGSILLRLDDGCHELKAGDCALIPGVDHGWKSGPDGCLLSVTMLGTPAL
jgi:quercetin dioxygenase-like cupin family protein